MNTLVLNLDWGSHFLKACAKVRLDSGPEVEVQLAGLRKGARIESWETLRHPVHGSLKAAFLSGQVQREELESCRRAAVDLLHTKVAQPLAERLRAAQAGTLFTYVNIHTPVRLTRAEVIVGSGLFERGNGDPRHYRITYRTAEAWHGLISHPAQPRENQWGHWVMTCLQGALERTGVFGQMVHSLLPESLTCVQDLATDIAPNKERQFLVLDVGHFTTDFALVAVLNWGQERLVVRRADSIFEAGSRFIKAKGESAWVSKVMATVTRFRPDLMDVGILGYAPLGVVLVGGGVQELSDQVKKLRIVEAIHQWALQSATYREGVVNKLRQTLYAPPPHLDQDLQILGEPIGQKHASQTLDLSLHLPSLLACSYSDMRSPIRVPGQDSVEVLLARWHHATVPFTEAVPKMLQVTKPSSSALRSGPRPTACPVTVQAVPPPRPLRPVPVPPRPIVDAKPSSRAAAKMSQPLPYSPSSVLAQARWQIQEGTQASEHSGLQTLESLARGGATDAALELALLHLSRRLKNVPSNPIQGMDWLRFAASTGNSQARSFLKHPESLQSWVGTAIPPELLPKPVTPTPKMALKRITPPSGDLGSAMELIQRGDSDGEQAGLATLKNLAQLDHAEALYLLGHLLVSRSLRHQPSQLEAGFHYLLRAAKLNHPRAIPMVAACYEKGIGTPVSERAAQKWRRG